MLRANITAWRGADKEHSVGCQIENDKTNCGAGTIRRPDISSAFKILSCLIGSRPPGFSCALHPRQGQRSPSARRAIWPNGSIRGITLIRELDHDASNVNKAVPAGEQLRVQGASPRSTRSPQLHWKTIWITEGRASVVI